MKLPKNARAIPGWPGYYVSKDGRVFSTKVVGFMGLDQSRNTGPAREMKSRLDGDGHLITHLHGGHGCGRRPIRVHTLVLRAFVGPPPTPQNVARHLNDDRTDSRLSNLAWRAPGLTETQARQIHALRVNGLSTRQIAKRLGVPHHAVGHICSPKPNRTWRHLGLGPAVPRQPGRVAR